MNSYTVYKHTAPNGKAYIGITVQKNPKRRWQHGLGYRTQTLFFRAILKYGWDNFKHEILFSGLTKEEAEREEIRLIKELHTTDRRYGYNIDNGGNCFGTHSEETKRKISEAQKGEKNHAWGKPSPRRGTKASPEAILKNRLSHLGHPSWCKGKKMTEEQKKNMQGKKRSDETKKKLSLIKSKRVICNETQVIYASCKEAAEKLGINRGSISNVACGKTKTAGGYTWSYL